MLQIDVNEWFMTDTKNQDVDSDYIDALMIERQKARTDKNFTRADEIRDELNTLKIAIEDTPDGPKWTYVG